jgi:hypothetical protein
MIVWGGHTVGDQEGAGEGAKYRPVTDTWVRVSTENAPGWRQRHSAVWTGSEMIVWGGASEEGYLATGGRYDPATDTWQSVSMDDPPSVRADHGAVWTGSEMLVWGGDIGNMAVTDGFAYDPENDRWRPIAAGGPDESWYEPVWTGDDLIVWRGSYNAALDEWTPICSQRGERHHYSAVWTGSAAILLGGTVDGDFVTLGEVIGVVYDPLTNASARLPDSGAGGMDVCQSWRLYGRAMRCWSSADATVPERHLATWSASTRRREFSLGDRMTGRRPYC